MIKSVVGQPDHSCRLCPRLAKFRAESAERYPGYFAAPVPAFGAGAPRWLIVGLAPGMHGANRTGRPFTGDHAGVLLYATLHELGASSAVESVSRDDGLQLFDVRITNAVKCLPPANKPTPEEIRTCNRYLRQELDHLGSIKVLVALGRIAHDATLEALGLRRSAFTFAHGAEHRLPDGRWLIDSYHCSRYNTQTRRLTPEMFRAVLGRAQRLAE
jgi:uracil-DNA glycosylase family 4